MADSSTILIIDDEPALLLGLASKIRRHGYNVVTAVDGRDALEKIRVVVPDLVLSDVMMPPPNGFELRKILSADARFASIPFIFLTARSGVQDRIVGLKNGADDYITKPFETEELFARIEAVLRRVQLERERVAEDMKEIARKDMEKLKQEILQNFHHELRTPLTNILLPLEMAANRRFENPEEQSRIIRIALSNADRLESLVTDLILMSNIDQGNLNRIRQSVDLRTNVYDPIRARMERYTEKNLILNLEGPEQAQFFAPRREFVHAILHLADNAFKFSPSGGVVSVRVQPLQNSGAAIEVQDAGPGIPVELREKVFERFYQVSQGDTRQHEGLGVGLTIAREVLKGLGGSVQILDCAQGCLVRAILPGLRSDEAVYG
ncbi:MAG: hybrid sensor histidine kinase/response regulator [Chloroflexi bacterium]|nr:hybrid sensor histidine kinase/response regulator [Chloroflexota bacterium]